MFLLQKKLKKCLILSNIKYTNRAVKDLKKIEQFNNELYGFIKSKEIIKHIIHAISILESEEADFTQLGIIDNSFTKLKNTYRKLIVKQYKINYREGKSTIYIVRVFDMRQHPNKNK